MGRWDRDVRLTDIGGTPYGPSNPVPTTGSGGGGGGAVTVADGADTCEGTTTDVAVTGDNPGTISAKLRGVNKILFSVWDSLNGRLKVDGSGVTQPVSGTVVADQGLAGSSSWPITGTVSVTNFPGTQAVSGTVTVNQGLAGSSSWPVTGTVDVGNFPSNQTVSGTVTVNQGSAGSSSWPITGGVSVSNFPASFTVNQGTAGSSSWSVTGSLTVTNFPSSFTVNQGTAGSSSWPVTGTVSVSNFPATQPVSGAVTANQGLAGSSSWPITGAVSVSNFPGTQTVSGTVTANQGTAGSSSWPVTGTINVGNFPGTQTVSGTVTANQGSPPWQVQGDVASGSAESGNPVKVGRVAVSHGTNPAAVSSSQRTNTYANVHGIPFVIGGHPNVQCIRQNFTSSALNNKLVSISAGSKLVVTRVAALLDKGCSVNVSVVVGFGSSSTPTTTGVVGSHPNIDPGGGFTAGDGSGILGVGGDGQSLFVTCSPPTGGSLDVLASYYQVPS